MRILILALLVACGGGQKPESKRVEPAPVKAASRSKLTLEMRARSSGGPAFEGVARDIATKAPLADVTVSMWSQSLQVMETAISDTSGKFALTELPPGDYAVSVFYADRALEGIVKVEADKVAIVAIDWDTSVGRRPQ